MSELQDLFEKKHPIPKGITRCGDHYAQTEFILSGDSGDYCAKFEGFAEAWQERQKRIDEALKLVCCMTDAYTKNMLEDALKGGEK